MPTTMIRINEILMSKLPAFLHIGVFKNSIGNKESFRSLKKMQVRDVKIQPIIQSTEAL
jgi:hypothetical protein